MDNTLSIGFDGEGELQGAFAEAGASDPGTKVRMVVEATVVEMAEDGISLVPDSVEEISRIGEPVEETPEEVEDDEGDTPAMVAVMKERDGGGGAES